MRSALAHVGRAHQSMASAALPQAFLQPDLAAARQTWRHVADQLRPRWPKLGKPMDDSEDDVLAYMASPPQHRTKLHSVDMARDCRHPSLPSMRWVAQSPITAPTLSAPSRWVGAWRT
jgi:transposase-like protein